ncbi:MAG: diguanylate cyclase [Burkholderiaceae bacterium]|nr:diguanylate cyclase [Burkholderiaceae bacterium]
MELFDKLSSQIASVGLPLLAVSLTAVPRADTPVMLMLHWHGFRKNPDRLHRLLGMQPVPVPGSALQVNEPWKAMLALDHAMLDAAWRLGAWELEREEKRACNNLGASSAEAFECQQAFASHPVQSDEAWVREAPDLNDLMHLGAKIGYVRWVFRPVYGGMWGGTVQDDTLSADGTRTPPCPVAPRGPAEPKASRTKYRLGQSTRLYLA